MSDTKESEIYAAPRRPSIATGEVDETVYDPKGEDEFEIFKQTTDGVQFRIVGWPKAAIIFLKVIFATGVLSIPTAMYGLGAVGGALSVVGWGALNTYFAIVQGNFRNSHAQCHSIADMAHVVGGPVLREICGGLFIIAYVLCAGSGVIGLSTGLNALSDHAACTVWWAFLSAVVIVSCASVRKYDKIGWLTWAGFVSIYLAVFIVVIGVTVRDRPAAAPATGDFDLGYKVIAYPSFMVGMTATCTIFVSSAGTSAFLPVISEMKNPRDYKKAVYVCMAVVQASYLTFALIVYRWCGKWVSNPSLGSAGPTMKKKNSFVHWGTWLSCTIVLGSISFILAEAIPIFSYLIALTGSICFAPLAIILPGWLWLHDHAEWKRGSVLKKMVWAGHWLLIAVGVFTCVGGTYGVVQSIRAAYKNGTIGGAFVCADNSHTHG
ncbi:amino acid transporter [Pleomassaria siparia CBS 279.74]|uniref:Amino acid transporter n=1 Tax=Pleomassaria siparia CBS 279.74 TaxID=1314801 RepID=A0A6G1K6U7_9PLEO|nr:amino acid transporter [Pleomassaria siparia CBS 279.74]